VKAVERNLFLFRRQLREVYARKFGSTISVLEKNFAFVLKGFDPGHNRHTEQRSNFCFVDGRVPEADMLLNNAALGIQYKRGGQSGDAAILDAHIVGGYGDGVVDAHFLNVFLDLINVLVIHIEPNNLKAILIPVLQRDKVRDFGAARSAPGSPEIQQDHFAVQGFERQGLAVERSQFEVRSRIGVADQADDWLVVHLRAGQRWHEKKEDQWEEIAKLEAVLVRSYPHRLSLIGEHSARSSPSGLCEGYLPNPRKMHTNGGLVNLIKYADTDWISWIYCGGSNSAFFDALPDL
jgi:prepilin-type processing-associated H-X9-DG protein